MERTLGKLARRLTIGLVCAGAIKYTSSFLEPLDTTPPTQRPLLVDKYTPAAIETFLEQVTYDPR